jgi:hypothetical protein
MPLFNSGRMGEMTSTDSRIRAQRYADSRWWTDGVKVVGYAIRCPEMDNQGREVFSVEILYSEGQKRTRYITVSDVASEVRGKRFHNIAWNRSLLLRRLGS